MKEQEKIIRRKRIIMNRRSYQHLTNVGGG